jgi:hypothetical protein
MAIFDNINEYKDFVSANVATDMQTLNIFIKRAIPIVLFKDGYMEKAFFAQILDEKTAGTTGLWADLIALVQMPIANYAAFLALNHLNIQISSAGVHNTITESKKPVFEWQMAKVQADYLAAVAEGQELMLAFLEENAAFFADWRDSAANQLRRSMFIDRPSVLQAFVYSESIIRVYWKLLSYLDSAENKIKAELGATFFTALKAEMKAGTVSPANETLLPFIRAYCAFAACAAGTADLAVQVSEKGLKTENDAQGFANSTAANEATVTAFREAKELSAKDSLTAMRNFLSTNQSDYPDWVKREYTKPRNSADSKIVHF